MNVTISQLVVNRDMSGNKTRMLSVIENSRPGDWVVFPEGVLSGYFPEDDSFMRALDAERIEDGIRDVVKFVQNRGCNCIFGSATFAEGAWRNSVLTVTADGQKHAYHKIELSGLDRRHFTPGTPLGVIRAGTLTIGVLACRELLFPSMWSQLKQAGAQVIFHINNAIQPHDRIWNHILITRAIEQGLFVCSVNNGAQPQELPSHLIAPSGRVLLETQPGRDDIRSAEITPCDAIPDLASRTDF